MAIQVKCFDEEHELDLERLVNDFLRTLTNQVVIDIKYSISHFSDVEGQVYSYSAMVIYEESKSHL
ncbi:MAG: sporulation protein Cse60 [Turicibacter sp.]|nr:sporulation protein Cse60 [Turicibacter sp.]